MKDKKTTASKAAPQSPTPPAALPRRAILHRKTRETDVHLFLDLDGRGATEIATGIGFFDHMLTTLAMHANFDLKVACKGDLHVDAHHTVEDVGVVLGDALAQALGDKRGIVRFGQAHVPLDEALVRAVVDLSGRAYLYYDIVFTTTQIGTLPVELVEDFFRTLCDHGRFNLHLDLLRGKSAHHIVESLFKATARALAMASTRDPRTIGVPSAKGSL